MPLRTRGPRRMRRSTPSGRAGPHGQYRTAPGALFYAGRAAPARDDLCAGAMAVETFKKARRQSRNGAAKRPSSPSEASHPAERPHDSPPAAALGAEGAADRVPDPSLVPMAALASKPPQVLSRQAAPGIA